MLGPRTRSVQVCYSVGLTLAAAQLLTELSSKEEERKKRSEGNKEERTQGKTKKIQRRTQALLEHALVLYSPDSWQSPQPRKREEDTPLAYVNGF